jgi:hypothetical protein
MSVWGCRSGRAASVAALLLAAVCLPAAGAERYKWEDVAENISLYKDQQIIVSVRLEAEDDVSDSTTRSVERKYREHFILPLTWDRYLALQKEAVKKGLSGGAKPGQRIWAGGTVHEHSRYGNPYWVLEAEAVRPYYEVEALPAEDVAPAEYEALSAKDVYLDFDRHKGDKVAVDLAFGRLDRVNIQRFEPMALDPDDWFYATFDESKLIGFVPRGREAMVETLKGLKGGAPVRVYGRVALASDYAERGYEDGVYTTGQDRDTPALVIDRVEPLSAAEAAADPAPAAPDAAGGEPESVAPRAYAENPAAYDGKTLRVPHVFRGSEQLAERMAERFSRLRDGAWLRLRAEETDLEARQTRILLVYRRDNDQVQGALRAAQKGDTVELIGTSHTRKRATCFIVEKVK